MLEDKWLAGEDFNAMHPLWGSRLQTTKGSNLYTSVSARNIRCYSTVEPTY